MENVLHITDDADKLSGIFDNKVQLHKTEKITELKVQVGIVIDITGSMSSYITACQKGVSSLVAENKDLDKKNIEIGIVGYRDRCDSVQIIKKDFFMSNEEINWEGFNASGGGDLPEDLTNGLKTCLNLNWIRDAFCKLIVILTDAPSHGNRYHNGIHDDYPDEDKVEENLEFFVRKIANKKINLFLVNITEKTEIMNEIIKDTFYTHIKKEQINLICSTEEKQDFQNQESINAWFTNFVHESIAAVISNIKPTEPAIPEIIMKVYNKSIITISVDANEHSNYAFTLFAKEFMNLNSASKLISVFISNSAKDDEYDYKNKKETVINTYRAKESSMLNMKFFTEDLTSLIHPMEQVNKFAIKSSSNFLVCGYNGMKGPKGDYTHLSQGVDYLLGNSIVPTLMIKENTPTRSEKKGYNWLFVLDRAYSNNCVKALTAFLPLVDNKQDFVLGYILLPSFDNYDDISKVFMSVIDKDGIENFEMEVAQYEKTASNLVNEKINYGDKSFDFVIFYNIPNKHKKEKDKSDVLNIVSKCLSNIGFVNE